MPPEAAFSHPHWRLVAATLTPAVRLPMTS